MNKSEELIEKIKHHRMGLELCISNLCNLCALGDRKGKTLACFVCMGGHQFREKKKETGQIIGPQYKCPICGEKLIIEIAYKDIAKLLKDEPTDIRILSDGIPFTYPHLKLEDLFKVGDCIRFLSNDVWSAFRIGMLSKIIKIEKDRLFKVQDLNGSTTTFAFQHLNDVEKISGAEYIEAWRMKTMKQGDIVKYGNEIFEIERFEDDYIVLDGPHMASLESLFPPTPEEIEQYTKTSRKDTKLVDKDYIVAYHSCDIERIPDCHRCLRKFEEHKGLDIERWKGIIETVLKRYESKDNAQLVSYNLNDKIFVDLTEKGVEVFKEHYSGIPGTPWENYRDIHFKNDEWEFQLWTFMNIFGKEFYMGNNNRMIKTNRLRLKPDTEPEPTKCILCHMSNETKDKETPQLCDTCKLEISHEVAMKNVSSNQKSQQSSTVDEGPRAFTKEEMRERLLNHIRGQVEYWENEERRPKSIDKLDGLAFSILVAFDGESLFPAMDIVMRPHPDDKQFSKNRGENWIEDGMVINDDCCLHDQYHQNPIEKEDMEEEETRPQMCTPQPVQLDCRNIKCTHHDDKGNCTHPNPAITLNASSEAVQGYEWTCWTRTDPEPERTEPTAKKPDLPLKKETMTRHFWDNTTENKTACGNRGSYTTDKKDVGCGSCMKTGRYKDAK